MTYPHVMAESATMLAAVNGASLARVGEGELRIAIDWHIKSQRKDPKLAAEMRAILKKPGKALLCLPRLWKGMPAEAFWRQFEGRNYSHLYGDFQCGSAFVSRPDMVNAIDTEEYWDLARRLWNRKDVVLAARSTKVLDLSAARSVRFVECPPTDAYDVIDRIEREIGQTNRTVLLAIGATATVLAVRLANKGIHAVDIGHMGKFMATAGAYSMERAALISESYVEQNRILHKRPEGYGGSGQKSVEVVAAFAEKIGAEGVLDYGCGQGTLKTALLKRGFKPWVVEYDPAIKGKAALPKPADLVCATDVLEHVEPEKLDAVLAHIYRLSMKGAYLLIATRKANKVLPDGRNAHLIIEGREFWLEKVRKAGFLIKMVEEKVGHDLKLWCLK